MEYITQVPMIEHIQVPLDTKQVILEPLLPANHSGWHLKTKRNTIKAYTHQ